jgi:hypothetical protein
MDTREIGYEKLMGETLKTNSLWFSLQHCQYFKQQNVDWEVDCLILNWKGSGSKRCHFA